MNPVKLWRHANVATFALLAGAPPYGWMQDASLRDRRRLRGLDWCRSRIACSVQARRGVALGGACVTPGLIDCHTHLVYAGNRAREFELRLTGATYEEIARWRRHPLHRGRHRAASDDQLLRSPSMRAGVAA